MYRAIRANDETEDFMQYPLAQEIDRHCRAHGYYVNNCDALMNGRLFLSVLPAVNNRFFPTIDFKPVRRSEYDTSYELRSRIQTGGYGALDLSDYRKFMSACNNAYELVTIIEEVVERIGIVPGETVALYQD